ncbi:HAD family hydrolase [Pengzhenrongella sp.]|uniref:HAD family hydrolase n=1 Tax=Pengzhenrongella sp. TaxID=2888820 RepID=UPI002F938727
MYRAILLDVYGTLVHDDDAPWGQVCAKVAELAGADPVAVEREWYLRCYRAADLAHGARFRTLADLNLSSLVQTAVHFGVRVDAAELCREQMAFWGSAPLFPDSLRFLREVGMPVCLVSDADRGDLAAVLALHGIVVDGVVTSEDARAYKPRAEPFELALAHLGLAAREVLHVGDSASSDIAGAQALGIDTAYIDRFGRPRPEVAPTYVVTSLTDLLPHLRKATTLA